MDRLQNACSKLSLDFNQFWAGSFQSQGKTAQQLVRDLGYQLVQYKYTTEDGHINSVYRLITNKEANETLKKQLRETKTEIYSQFFDDEKKEPNAQEDKYEIKQKPVVICQHGLQDSMMGFLMNDEQSIGIRLVDAGFDVWLNNSRGNKFSKEHKYLDIIHPEHGQKDINPDINRSREQFFNYSFHEMGLYDQPALWKKVMEVTGQDRIAYIGHSQGTTQMFVSMMAYPEFYAKHMKVFVALCPVVYWDHVQIDLALAFNQSEMAQKTLKDQGPEMTEVPMNFLFQNVFSVSESSQEFIISLMDKEPEQVSQKAIQNFQGHYPAGTSLKSVLHFFQVMNSKEFQMYDYGTPELNKKYYGGQETPPKYPWERLKDLKKIVLVPGRTDRLTEWEDILKLKTKLEEQNALLEFRETPLGHIGTIWPAKGNDDHLNYIINDLLKNLDKETNE